MVGIIYECLLYNIIRYTFIQLIFFFLLRFVIFLLISIGVAASDLPATESLKDTVARFLPAWHNEIAPAIKSGKKVLIAAHGNSLRALIKYLDNINDNDIVELNIPTAIPLVYELDSELKPIRHYYLGDAAAAEAKAQAVVNQAAAKK